MRWLKIFGTLVSVALLLWLIVINFSAVESHFQCRGEISSRGLVRTATVYLKLEKFRWWVGLWSDSAGYLSAEVPNKDLKYLGAPRFYPHLEESGDLLHVADSTKRTKGSFSTLSNSIAIDMGADGFFDGTCKRVEQ